MDDRGFRFRHQLTPLLAVAAVLAAYGFTRILVRETKGRSLEAIEADLRPVEARSS